MLELFLYWEVNLFAIFLLVVLIHNIRAFSSSSINDKLYVFLMASVVVILVIDMGCWLVDGRRFPMDRLLNNVFEALYYIASAVLSYIWYCYAVFRAKDSIDAMKKNQPLNTLPGFVVIALALLSPFTGWLFRITPDNHYLRGPLFLLQAVICWGYLAGGSLVALVRARHETMKSKQRDYYMLASFALYPLLGRTLQTLQYGLTLVWPMAACSLFLIYMDQQQRQIANDALTGINNRRRMNGFLENKLENHSPSDPLYLIMIDVDYFKQINDKYGHTAGDLALIRVADILKRAIARGRNSDFLARYGGDEFSILCCRHSADEMEQVLTNIRLEVAADNERRPHEPVLSLSLGYARVQRSPHAAEKAVAEADAMMYKEKEEHHRLNELRAQA